MSTRQKYIQYGRLSCRSLSNSTINKQFNLIIVDIAVTYKLLHQFVNSTHNQLNLIVVGVTVSCMSICKELL
jgi:c-di-GMP-related signal transduction protein